MEFHRKGIESTGRKCPVENVFTKVPIRAQRGKCPVAKCWKVFTKVIRRTQEGSALFQMLKVFTKSFKEIPGGKCTVAKAKGFTKVTRKA